MNAAFVTLVCPACNEADNIAPLLREWHAEFTRLALPFELLVVDDGSVDGTADEVRRMAMELRGVRLLRHPVRRGQSAALATGIAGARGEVIVTCDADLQNDPADLERILDLLPQADVVCGWRHNRQDSWRRRFVSRWANRIMQQLFGHQLHDSGCALRVFRRPVVGRLLPIDGLHRFFSLLAVIEGFTVVEVPVNHRPRVRGQSKYGVFNRLFRTVRDLSGLWWYRSRRSGMRDLTAYEEPLAEQHVESRHSGDDSTWPLTIPFRQKPGGVAAGTRKSA